MSTDQYPEVSSEDSGLVPQHAAKPEWPKKIRTLSAAELDRLTIDSDGRFYWDGNAVQGPQLPPPPMQAAQQPALQALPPGEPTDLDALALLDRAARELSGRPAPEPTIVEGNPPQASHEAVVEQPHPSEPTVVALVPQVAAPETSHAVTASPSAAPTPFIDTTYRMPVERVRVRMSFWQSLALVAVVIGLLIGAVGIAISGLVAAHEWGCRTNLLQQYCPPPPPAPKPPVRFDIPA